MRAEGKSTKHQILVLLTVVALALSCDGPDGVTFSTAAAGYDWIGPSQDEFVALVQQAAGDIEPDYLLPILEERARQPAGSLSGGQQQMVTIGRALMTRPKLIVLDEPSQVLAPKPVYEVFETVGRLQQEVGLTIPLVAQHADASLASADYVYVMHEGVIQSEGTPEEIRRSDEIREAYLGI